jgi:hypothetical protein
MVNNIFAYGLDAKVFLCAINFPSSWNDGSIRANILPYICWKIGNYKICVDQGFPRSEYAALILVGLISGSQAQSLLQIFLHTYFVCQMFMSLLIKQVNGA